MAVQKLLLQRQFPKTVQVAVFVCSYCFLAISKYESVSYTHLDVYKRQDKNWAIGNKGGLLCHLSGDLKYFKERTQGKTVVMGRPTLESLPGGKPLPKRENIVLTTRADYAPEGVLVVHSAVELDEVLARREPDPVSYTHLDVYKRQR